MSKRLSVVDVPNDAAIDAAENAEVEVTILPAGVGSNFPDDAVIDAANGAVGKNL